MATGRKSVQFGLPEDLIEEHIQHKKCCASPVALFLAARRQRFYISESGGMFARLEREAEVCTSPAPVVKKRGGEVRESPTVSSTSEKLWTTPCKTLSMGNRYILEVCFHQEHLIPNPLGAGSYTLHLVCKSLWHAWEELTAKQLKMCVKSLRTCLIVLKPLRVFLTTNGGIFCHITSVL